MSHANDFFFLDRKKSEGSKCSCVATLIYYWWENSFRQYRIQKEIQPNVGTEKCVENDWRTLDTGLHVTQTAQTTPRREAHEAKRNLSPLSSPPVLLLVLLIPTWRCPVSYSPPPNSPQPEKHSELIFCGLGTAPSTHVCCFHPFCVQGAMERAWSSHFFREYPEGRRGMLKTRSGCVSEPKSAVDNCSATEREVRGGGRLVDVGATASAGEGEGLLFLYCFTFLHSVFILIYTFFFLKNTTSNF